MEDSFSFKITIMPPDWRPGHPDPPSSSIRKVAVPSAPSETFANVWESLKMRYFALYNESITSRGYFHKLQTSDGCDIAAGIDEVGKLGFGPRSPPEQLQLVMLQNALDREGSIAFDSLMRPKSAKRVAPSDSEVKEAKRRRAQQEQYGAPVEDLLADQPIPSREPESSSQEESGASHANSRTTTVWQEDSQGFKAPQRIRQASKRESAIKNAQPQNDDAEDDQHEDQEEAQDEEQQELIDEENVETNLPRQDPYRELSFSPEVPNPLDPTTRTPHTRRTASTKGPVSAQTSRSSSRHPLTANRKYKEPPTPVSAEEIASTYSASTTARQPRTGRANAVATPTLSFTTEPQRQSQPAEDFPNDEDALADSDSPVDDVEEDPGYKSAIKKQLEAQSSAAATPKLWTVDEDILLLNNPEKTAVFVSKILKNNLGMFRTSSAVRSRRTLLAEKGVSVKTLSQQSSEQAAKSSQLTDSSPLVAKKSAAAKSKPSTQDTRAGFTSINEVQLPAKQTRAMYRGFPKLGSSAPSSDNASPNVNDKNTPSIAQQTTFFSKKSANGKGKEPAKDVRASYAELNARYQSKHCEQRGEAVVVSDDDTGHSKASSEYNDARAIEDSQHAAASAINKAKAHEHSGDEATEEQGMGGAQEMAARAMDQHKDQQEPRQSSVRSSDRAALAGTHDAQTSSTQRLRDRRQPANESRSSEMDVVMSDDRVPSNVVMSDDQVSVQDELAQLASHGVEAEENSHHASSQEDGDVMNYYDRQAMKGKKVIQDSNTESQPNKATNGVNAAASSTVHNAADDEDLKSDNSDSPQVSNTVQANELENQSSSDPLTNQAGGRLTRPRPIGHSSILISARPFSQREASSVMVPETQLDEQTLVAQQSSPELADREQNAQQRSSAESAEQEQNAQQQSFMPQEESDQGDSEQSSAEDVEEKNSPEPSIYSTPQGVSQEENEVERDGQKIKKVLARGVNTEDSSSEYSQSDDSSDESDGDDAEYHSSSESAGSQQIAKKGASADVVASSDESSDEEDGKAEQTFANGVNQKQSKTALRGSGKSINPFHVSNAHIPRASSSRPKENRLTLADQLKSAVWSKKSKSKEESESDSDDSEVSDES